MKEKKTILAVLAHPDDESFGMGGTLALYASQGHAVYLICATRGEAGTVDEHYLNGYASIAELRENELRCAASQLGLRGVFFLDYRDSGMTGAEDNRHPAAQINAPLAEVAAKVVGYIRELKPDVVLTFDEIGGYRHPDHIHIQQATVLAFEHAADATFHPQAGPPFQPAKLYFHTIPRGFLKFGVALIKLFGKDPKKWGRNGDIDLASLANVDFPTHARIDYTPVSDKKTRASACHASQGGSQMRRGLIGMVFRLLGESDTFMQAYPPPESGQKIQKSLF
ncbi:MAG: PIG-L family deacetylase [Anaerolineales bacterium]|jgi:LmbE family N-acetylglucosaminyl deacetylase|nr:PIG-L family deacetylase [Anaerolineales bacterium]